MLMPLAHCDPRGLARASVPCLLHVPYARLFLKPLSLRCIAVYMSAGV